MAKRWVGRRAVVVAGLLLGGLGWGIPAVAQELTERGRQQIRAIYADKATRTPAQKKLATSLLFAHRESLGRAMVQGLGPLRRIANRARVGRDGTVVVDIQADVTDRLLKAIGEAGGRVALAFPALGAVRARVPIRQVEAIAALPDVRHIGPQQTFLANTGLQTSQGDIAHAAASARGAFSIDGTGVKVGVLSDGVDSLAARQTTGDLPPTCAATPGPGACVAVLPLQAGSGDGGTAMLEIVHDLAPGAQLYFATAVDGDASFATNIVTLKNTYGCDILVDDFSYVNEGAFQDGVIAQAVNTVKAAGALFFSSAGDSGRLSAGTSGTWEGDFLDSLTTIHVPTDPDWPDLWDGLPIHSWNGLTGGSAANSNPLTADADSVITLKWSDPQGGAITDYDLFLFDSGLTTIYDLSYSDQTIPGQDPYEEMGFGLVGERIVVVLWSGPTKALRLDTHRGRLARATAGAVFGHNGGDSTVSVAAANVSSAGGGAFTGGLTNPIETYSSDGPRRMFFNPNGTAITPGNVLFGTNGGRSLQKPDVTAADCVTTTTPGFISFCGTSSAAAHAAAIAALLTSAPSTSGGQAQAAMFATALDVNPAGRDRDAGVGIVMANLALAAVLGARPEVFAISDAAVAEGALGAATELTLTVSLSFASEQAITVDYATVDGTATANSDYLPNSGKLYFPAGTTSKPISVTILGDSSNEANETFSIVLSNPSGASIPDGTGIGTIIDDDAAGFSIDDVAVVEPATGTTAAVFTVTLSPPSAATVSFTTVNGAATASGDYATTSGVLTFSAATPTQTVSVPVNADAVAEGIETFSVSLSSSSGPALVRPLGTGSISDVGFYTIAPCRLVDTRAAGQGAPALVVGVDRVFALGSKCGLPSTATAVSFNITVTGTTGAGNLRLWKAGTTMPTVSAINWSAGQTRANNAIIPLSAVGQVAVRAQGSGVTDVILDVNGFFE
jgi:hypothetical protein